MGEDSSRLGDQRNRGLCRLHAVGVACLSGERSRSTSARQRSGRQRRAGRRLTGRSIGESIHRKPGCCSFQARSSSPRPMRRSSTRWPRPDFRRSSSNCRDVARSAPLRPGGAQPRSHRHDAAERRRSLGDRGPFPRRTGRRDVCPKQEPASRWARADRDVTPSRLQPGGCHISGDEGLRDARHGRATWRSSNERGETCRPRRAWCESMAGTTRSSATTAFSQETGRPRSRGRLSSS